MADRCAILNRGKVAQIGTPRELYEEPVDRFTAEFLGEANFFCGRVSNPHDVGSLEIELAEPEGTVWKASTGRPTDDGSEVLCMVRPESWAVDSDSPERVNRIEGRIVSSLYLGEVTQHTFVPDSAPSLEIEVLETAAPPRPSGRAVLSTTPESVVVLEGR